VYKRQHQVYGHFTISIRKQDGVLIGNVVSDEVNQIKAVYVKEGDNLKPTWLKHGSSGDIGFALKTDLPEDTANQFIVLYENDKGERLVSEAYGEWQKN